MTWSWEDGRGKRHYYSIQSVLDLESNPKSSSLQVYSENKKCDVNVKEMTHGGSYQMYREVAGVYISAWHYRHTCP